MLRFGLTPRQFNEVLGVISRFTEIESAIIFGSRARNHHLDTSDIDLALKGELLTRSILTNIQMAFDDSSLPYFVDILHYSTLADNELCRQHIDSEGVIIYRQSPLT